MSGWGCESAIAAVQWARCEDGRLFSGCGCGCHGWADHDEGFLGGEKDTRLRSSKQVYGLVFCDSVEVCLVWTSAAIQTRAQCLELHNGSEGKLVRAGRGGQGTKPGQRYKCVCANGSGRGGREVRCRTQDVCPGRETGERRGLPATASGAAGSSDLDQGRRE